MSGNDDRARLRFRSDCPVSSSLDILGDKWSLLVMRDILLGGKRTFTSFRKSDEGIATNILSDRLQRLEAAGLVTRRRNPDNRRIYLYEATPHGEALRPVLFAIAQWASVHLADVHPTLRRLGGDDPAFAEPAVDDEA